MFNDELQKELQNELDAYLKYGDYSTDKYKDHSTEFYHRLRIMNFMRLFAKIKFPQNANALDIGCAGGTYAIILAKSDFNTFGIDIYGKALKEATSWVKNKKINNLKFLIANAEMLPFKDNSFDFVVCSEVFEHLDNPLKGIQEFKRILKPDGIGIVSMPNLLSCLFLPRRVFDEIKNKDIDPHYKFSFIRIKNMLRHAGLLIQYDNSVGYLPFKEFIYNDRKSLFTAFEKFVSKRRIPFGAFYFAIVKKKENIL